ncbi:GreA/GreB family elongation factor [Pseudobdellovibrio exovorus]|uniref:Transcription elongation factor GreA/GreB C-terminal domain-containing protein n=1 Tax=Pseudobdellovibrio exovorus JSS TaxID=1184267 RepID=M4V602_9BACT|nr:GreA/GreB family elongation factor [Pseudobdellovibrio exovorus]AGH94608.1 hypothetical protein A11Q_388 [Pseudobdellovibrio exovorus JSS]
MLNKSQLLKLLKDKTRQDLESALTAARNTYDVATHEDNKAENKYDTRGLEASYLAGAQAKRAADIKLTLDMFENLQLREFKEDSKIALTALIEIQHQDKSQLVFLLPRGGGLSVQIEGQGVQVITPESPLGKALIGRECGDVVEVPTGAILKEYEINQLS